MANMFAAHPEVFIPLRETDAFRWEREARRRRRELLAEFRLSGKEFLAEKTPRHIANLDRIRAMMRAPRFVLMVRCGRDVAASFIKRFGSSDEGISRWIEAGEIILSQADRPDVIVLRYEDLIAAPQQKLEEVCAFAGLPFDEAMLRYHESPRGWFGKTALEKGSGEQGAEHAALRSWQVNQPIFDGRRKWVGKLSDKELEVFSTGRARELMEAFGYGPED
ncbi:sulfotransferase family protein [Ancylobacter sp.]|uniref:sulfotransferase family protein n=1 Tax=Ancylobacter sp. TaxID=1872567 RepID=UPI003D123160